MVQAPDARVFINGEQDIQGCPSCHRRFDLGNYITSVTINLDVDSAPGSASVSLSMPKHALDDIMVDGVCVISPMMEIEVYGKGFFLVEGMPQYYPIFWGLITGVTDSYSGGAYTIEIACADILKWWEICRMNINPAFTAPSGQLGTSIFGNVLFGTNPYDLIFSLAQMSFGDVIMGTGSLVSLVKENAQQATFTAAMGDIMHYWTTRFSRIRSNLLLYGVNGIAVRGDTLSHGYETGKLKSKNVISNTIRMANGGPGSAQVAFDPTSPEVTAFRTQFSSAGEVNFWQSEYQTKLEIANACKEAIGFEFYMDVTGDIVFKPPFYNLDILSNKPISWIQPIDIIDASFEESEGEVVTQLQIQGSYGGAIEYGFGQEITPFSSVVDYHLLKKYGWRPHTMNSEFLGDTLRMFYHGLDMLDRINCRRFSGSVTIPFRPELRLGFPIYVSHKDAIWYIKGINHSITFGGRATTQLTITARRSKFVAIQGMSVLKKKGGGTRKTTNVLPGEKVNTPPPASRPRAPTISELENISFELELGDAGTIPPTNVNENTAKSYEPLLLRHPKTGRIVGYPNAVMVYVRPYEPTPEGHAKSAGLKVGPNPRVDKSKREEAAKRGAADLTATVEVIKDRAAKVKEKYTQNRSSYGLNSAGVYVYAHDQDQTITQFVLLKAQNITVSKGGQPTSDLKFERSSMVRPVSDERGFEVIGHFPYGRGASIRDGSLILSDKGQNTRATVDTPLALSGSLSTSLAAQSQGLTTVSTGVIDVASALSRLQPEDLQTAGVLNPETKTPEFTSEGTNFVSTAPLGSLEHNGVPQSVEASQLSKALTLAELTIKMDAGNEPETNCACQSGRADLAFIATGYQIKSFQESNTAAKPKPASDITDDLKPTASSLKGEALRNKVEEYLFKLYSALDADHQVFETAIRGGSNGNVEEPAPTFSSVPQVGPTTGDFSPPFSAMGRAEVGDPRAIALAASSEVDGLKNRFDKFGQDLVKEPKRKALSEEIEFLASRIGSLVQELSKLDPSTSATPDLVRDRKAAIEAEVATLRQQVADKQLQLEIL